MKQFRSLFSSRINRPTDAASSYAPPPKRRKGIGGFIWRGIKRLCMVMGAFVLITTLLGVFSTVSMFTNAPPPLPDEMVLFLKLEGDIQETQVGGGMLDPFGANKATIHDIIKKLDHGAMDPKVKGLYVRLGGGARLQLAHIQELRAAVKRFQAAGKFAFIYSPSYGEGGGIGAYYLASAFNNIWMQPIGVVVMNGMRAEVPFARGALDKLGVRPEFLQRKEYKSAYESLSRSSMSPANRESMKALLEDLRLSIMGDIAADHDMDMTAVMTLVDKGLFTADAALKAGLVGKLGYADMLAGDIAEAISGKRDDIEGTFVPLKNYAQHTKPKKLTVAKKGDIKKPKSAKIAVIHVNGTIMPRGTGAQMGGVVSVLADRASMMAPLGIGGNVAAADEIAPAIFDAANDKDIKTIIIRIDSPGGSPTASETILRAIQRAKAKGKTVVISMGGAAASGGYWIAAGGDYIFALPTTLTGSIGVIGGKFSLNGLWDNMHVNWDSVGWGKNAGLWSMNTPFSTSEKTQIDLMLDQVYDGFIARVAQGRGMSLGEVEKIARGRVWSGKAALEHNLVDANGGMTDALDYVAKLNNVESRANLNIVTLPKPKTALEQFIDLIESGGVIEFFKLQSWMAKHIKNYAAALGIATY